MISTTEDKDELPKIWDERTVTIISGEHGTAPHHYQVKLINRNAKKDTGDQTVGGKPEPARFANNTPESDCKVCNDKCEDVTPDVLTGILYGIYDKRLQDCKNKEKGENSGILAIARLDAIGPKPGDPKTFPKFACLLKKRSGVLYNATEKRLVAEPVIIIKSGGEKTITANPLRDQGTTPISLYGVECNSTNTWILSAKDDGYDATLFKRQWTKRKAGVPAGDPTEEDLGNNPTQTITLGVGRWIIGLSYSEIIREPNRPARVGAQVAKAEIHTFVVEHKHSDNVDGMPPLHTPEDERRGKIFGLRGKCDPTIDLDTSLSVDKSPSGARGRISLDAYPQNEYWALDGDSLDLAQVLSVKHDDIVEPYIQGYVKQSDSLADKVKVRVEGQSLIELCDQDCCGSDDEEFLGKPIKWYWEFADDEPLNIVEPNILADTNRNGGAPTDADDEGEDKWHNRRGAIILVNNDKDDPANLAPDNFVANGGNGDPGNPFLGVSTTDQVINGPNDRSDLSQLLLRRIPALPPPGEYSVWIKMYETQCQWIRIFDDLDQPFLGPDHGVGLGEFKKARVDLISDIRSADRLYLAEALAYPKRDFQGPFDVWLCIQKGTAPDGAEICVDHLQIQVTPGLLQPNNADGEVLYLMEHGTPVPTPLRPGSGVSYDEDNGAVFRRQIEMALGVAAGAVSPNLQHATTPDPWAQDEWEMGFSTVPVHPAAPAGPAILPTVFDLPRGRAIDRWGKTNLLGPVLPDPNIADARRHFHLERLSEREVDSVEYGGNIEVAPPFKDHRYGVVVMGQTYPGNLDNGPVRNFLKDQKLQTMNYKGDQLIEPDTGWLDVAHCDEFMSFIPGLRNAGGGDWKLVLADTQMAVSLMRALDNEDTGNPAVARAAIDRTVTVTGKTWAINQWRGGVVLVRTAGGITVSREIESNTADTITAVREWSVPVAVGDTLTIIPESAFAGMMRAYTDPVAMTTPVRQDLGTVTGAVTGTTLQDITRAGARAWVAGLWTDSGRACVRIVEGRGAGQMREITANTAQTITVNPGWTTNPDRTSVYVITADSKYFLFSAPAPLPGQPNRRVTVPQPAFVTVYDLLHNTGNPALSLGGAGETIAKLQNLSTKQPAFQDRIDFGKRAVTTKTGIADADLIKVPAWFFGTLSGGGRVQRRSSIAYWPGMANLQVWNRTTLLIPEPFGPMVQVGGVWRDVFKSGIGTLPGVNASFTAQGLTPIYVDCWYYHTNTGETHCGTNVRRTPLVDMRQWWENWPLKKD